MPKDMNMLKDLRKFNINQCGFSIMELMVALPIMIFIGLGISTMLSGDAPVAISSSDDHVNPGETTTNNADLFTLCGEARCQVVTYFCL